jgi:hypothetical protein
MGKDVPLSDEQNVRLLITAVDAALATRPPGAVA